MSTPDIANGNTVYNQVCAACHQPTGLGLAGVFPPLDGSDWVTGPAGLPISIILKGLQGPIDVNGVTYNSMMPAAGYLTDQQIADVTTYIRQAWSNKADAVTAETVAQVKEMTSEQVLPWTAEQLQALVAEHSGSATSAPAVATSTTSTTLANTGSFDVAKITDKSDSHWFSFGWVIGALIFVVAIIAGLKKLTH